MTGIDPKYTLGDIAQSRDEVVRRLVAEGLLDRNRRHRLSPVPSAHRRRHERRYRGMARLSPRARAQCARGSSCRCATCGCRASSPSRWWPLGSPRWRADADLDAIVVIRGGGAKNELAVFDSELIARTIAACRPPRAHGPRPRGRPERRRRGRAHRAEDPDRLRAALYRAGPRLQAEHARKRGRRSSRGSTTARVRRPPGCPSSPIASPGGRMRRSNGPTSVCRSRVDRLTRCGPAVLASGGTTTRLPLGRRSTERSVRCSNARPTDSTSLEARVASLDPAVQLARGWSITADRRRARSSARSTTSVDDDIITTSLIDGSITSTVRVTTPIEGPSA